MWLKLGKYGFVRKGFGGIYSVLSMPDMKKEYVRRRGFLICPLVCVKEGGRSSHQGFLGGFG
jgi:hypothetical protein